MYSSSYNTVMWQRINTLFTHGFNLTKNLLTHFCQSNILLCLATMIDHKDHISLRIVYNLIKYLLFLNLLAIINFSK